MKKYIAIQTIKVAAWLSNHGCRCLSIPLLKTVRWALCGTPYVDTKPSHEWKTTVDNRGNVMVRCSRCGVLVNCCSSIECKGVMPK